MRCVFVPKAARGLAMGTASHALGTARCAELDYQEGAFSSLALVLCGIITSLIAPVLFDYSGSNGLKNLRCVAHF